MEKKLKCLFDMQKYENNPRLAKLIDESVGRYAAELSDDELTLVNAAGETDAVGKPGDITGDFVGNDANDCGRIFKSGERR